MRSAVASYPQKWFPLICNLATGKCRTITPLHHVNRRAITMTRPENPIQCLSPVSCIRLPVITPGNVIYSLRPEQPLAMPLSRRLETSSDLPNSSSAEHQQGNPSPLTFFPTTTLCSPRLYVSTTEFVRPLTLPSRRGHQGTGTGTGTYLRLACGCGAHQPHLTSHTWQRLTLPLCALMPL